MNNPNTPIIFITGANGLVGSFIAEKYINQGYNVRALRRPGSDLQLVSSLANQIDWVEGDILDIALVEKSLEGVSYVVHAAAFVSFAPHTKEEMYRVNVEGTANVVNACLQVGIKKLCHVSSVAALGRSIPKGVSSKEARKRAIAIDEDAKWEKSALNSHYAQSKHLAELEVWRGVAEGLNTVIVNPALILGAGDWNKSSARLFRYVWKETPFYTEGTANCVDVRDVVDIIYLLMHSDISAKRFILSAGSIPYEHLFNRIADSFSKKKPAIKVGATMAEILWRLEWIRSQFTGKKPLVTKETAQLARYSFIYKNDHIKKELDFTFRSIDTTIEWCCKSLKPIDSVKVNVN